MKKLLIVFAAVASFAAQAQMFTDNDLPWTVEQTYTASTYTTPANDEPASPVDVTVTTDKVENGTEVRTCKNNSLGYWVCTTYTEAVGAATVGKN